MIREKIFFLGFMIMSYTLIANKAPDFYVATVKGNEISLYKDFLNKGKVVVIELFFADCPPCNNLAPFMNQFYNELKKDEIPVEFISLSDKSWDNDENVIAFQNKYKHQWHYVSPEGGSLDVVKNYEDGTFGPFWGTPTTIVIAPNGEVSYNVRGSIGDNWISSLRKEINRVLGRKYDDKLLNSNSVIKNKKQVEVPSYSRKGKDFAYFFYVEDFDNGWSKLPETRIEVTKIADELKSNYNFDVKIIANPTKREILESIKNANNQKYQPDHQVLFFFSTHGYYNEETNRGYLIPSDGKKIDPYGASWVSYEDLGSYVTLNSCNHVMLALDACYSGAFGDRYKGKPQNSAWDDSSANCIAQARNALKFNSRLYFSSGSKEQRTPAASLFAKRWLNALRNGYEKGIVRSNDLRYHLGTIEYPVPENGTFIKDEGGDFIFMPKNACGDTLFENADEEHWKKYMSLTSKKLLIEHLKQFPSCNHYNKALQILSLKDSSSKKNSDN